MVNINVTALDIDATMDQSAKITSVSYENIEADAQAKIFVSLNHFRRLFNFQTDASDITDAGEEDIQYKIDIAQLDISGTNFNPSGALMIDGHAGAENILVSAANSLRIDFVKHMSLDLFTDPNAASVLFENYVDLVDDITVLGEEINQQIRQRLIDSSENNDNDNTVNNVTREILRQMISQAPERFVYDTCENIASMQVSTEYQQVPFNEGDTLRYKLTLRPESETTLTVPDICGNLHTRGPVRPKIYEIIMELREKVNTTGFDQYFNLKLTQPSDSLYNKDQYRYWYKEPEPVEE